MDCTHLNILGPMALYSIIILTLYRNDRIMLKVIKSNQYVNLSCAWEVLLSLPNLVNNLEYDLGRSLKRLKPNILGSNV